MKRAIIDFILAGVLIILLLALLREEEPAPVEPPRWSAVELLRNQHKEELTEWQMLQMAIAYTESRFRDDAVGKANDSGQMQITEPYVREINRLYHTNYKLEDAFDFGKTLEMYDLMQRAYNPDRDLNEAIKHHNRSAYYRATVLDNLELIRRYEATRKQVLEYGK